MGTRYNAAHISEAQAKEAWAQYSRWDYYYNTEIAKAEETFKKAKSSARSRLIAKGITEDNPMYGYEMERISGIMGEEMGKLKEGQQRLKTGAIKKVLTEAPITKYSKGNYGRYISHYDSTVEAAERQLDDLGKGEQGGGKYYQVSKGGLRDFSQPTALQAANPGSDLAFKPRVDTRHGQSEFPEETVRVDAEGYKKLRGQAQEYVQKAKDYRNSAASFEEYYSSIWGEYDASNEMRQQSEEDALSRARGKAGTRSYKQAVQPKGIPGGGRSGNPFLQDVMEVAKEEAPEEERGKAWWM